METTIVYWGSLWTMEKKMEATIIGFGISFFWRVSQRVIGPLCHIDRSLPPKRLLFCYR